jgi:hypothetical protein
MAIQLLNNQTAGGAEIFHPPDLFSCSSIAEAP